MTTTAPETNMRILLIEDDKNVAGFVTKGLREAGHNVIHADCAQVGRDRANNEQFDVIILDRILPDANDGLNLLTNLRAQRNDTPVLILSGLTRPQAKVKGFGMGADDYITKPFDKSELVARIQAVIRRSKGYAAKTA